MAGNVHIVSNGETLFMIAQANGTTVKQLLEDNPHLKITKGNRIRSEDGSFIYQNDEVVITSKSDVEQRVKSDIQCGWGKGNSLLGCKSQDFRVAILPQDQPQEGGEFAVLSFEIGFGREEDK